MPTTNVRACVDSRLESLCWRTRQPASSQGPVLPCTRDGHPPPREGTLLVSTGGLLRITAGAEPELAKPQLMGVARMVSPGSVMYAAGGTAPGLTQGDGVDGLLRLGWAAGWWAVGWWPGPAARMRR